MTPRFALGVAVLVAPQLEGCVKFDTIISELGSERAPASVWVDENDFVRRMSYEWTIELDGSAGPGGRTTQNVELTFSDFGEEVSVELPPPDETVDFNELLEG